MSCGVIGNIPNFEFGDREGNVGSNPAWTTKKVKKIIGEKNSQSQIGNKNSFYGKKHTEETIELMKSKRNNMDMSFCHKKVAQIDKETMDIIKIWDSISDAAEQVLGYRKSSRITAACKGRSKTCGGYVWKYTTPAEEASLIPRSKEKFIH